MNPKPIKTLLARALYKNESEFPTELSFLRGDVVTVIERNPEGYEGWWICSLRGKIGIVPGNRFELLGLVSKDKSEANNNLYDDPKEWTDNETSTLVPITPQTITMTAGQPTDTYASLDCVKPMYRVSGLTDSGNYSNRSSAISLSLQSMAGSTWTGVGENRVQRATPDSQFEDYEDLDLDNTASCKLDVDWSSRALPPVPETVHLNLTQRLGPSIVRLPSPVTEIGPACGHNGSGQNEPARGCPLLNEAELVGEKPPMDKLTTATPDRRLTPVCPESRNVQTPDLENNSLASNDSFVCTSDGEILRTGFLKDQQDILTALRSSSEFVKFLNPIKQRVDDHSKQALFLIKNDHSVLDPPVLAFCLTKLLQELNILNQTCGMLAYSSRESPDAGLTRKFLSLRKTTEDVTTRLRSIVAELDIQGTEVKRSSNFQNLERLILAILQTMESLDTTVLANASLLFNASKIIKRHNSTVTDHNFEIKSMEELRTLSNSVPDLNQLDKSEIDAGLKDLESLDPQQFKLFQEGIRLLHAKCQTSLTSMQQFLDGLETNDCSSANVRVPRNLLSTNFLTIQVKTSLHHTSLLIRSIAEFRSTLCSSHKHCSNTETNNYLRKISVELENRGSAVCEALKGLVIQTKEAIKHVQNEVPLQPTRDMHSTLPIPAPLWQRLLGSSRSVCSSLTILKKILYSHLIQDSRVLQI